VRPPFEATAAAAREHERGGIVECAALSNECDESAHQLRRNVDRAPRLLRLQRRAVAVAAELVLDPDQRVFAVEVADAEAERFADPKAGRETTVMESTIYEVAANLRKTKDFDAAVAALAALAPDANDFVARSQRASVSRIATARYLLRELEHAKRRTQELSVEGTDRVHVEHIYPQTPDGARWPNHAQMINRPTRELDVARQASEHLDQER
jgi:hypothetical protein